MSEKREVEAGGCAWGMMFMVMVALMSIATSLKVIAEKLP